MFVKISSPLFSLLFSHQFYSCTSASEEDRVIASMKKSSGFSMLLYSNTNQSPFYGHFSVSEIQASLISKTMTNDVTLHQFSEVPALLLQSISIPAQPWHQRS
ncbi:hypothetical protein Leryth_015226 [Lithospermum erythrorhizon]|nr:hypothetical protein Leryth_015226 [Lithospermum erythrorhizon]